MLQASSHPENTNTTSSAHSPLTQNGTPISYAPSPVASSSGSTPWPPQPPSTVQSPVVPQQSSQHFYAPSQPVQYNKRLLKGRKRTLEETEIANETAARVAARLAEDQAAVINPDVDTPFQDEHDVVKRLLPYHIYQQPRDDLQFILNGGKGKGKSVDRSLKAEIEETKFAIDCCERLEQLRRRWRNVKIRQGQHASPSDQAYVLAQAVVETERTDTALLTGELKAARSELERIQKEQRIAANAARMTQYPANPVVPSTTAPPTPISTQHYYRTYPYNYAQPYTSSVPQAPVSTTSTFSVSVAPSPAPPPPQSSYTSAAYQSGGAIPVQLPVSSLPGLHQLGIVPVPANSLPPEGQPQPPAILRGSTSNGTMLSLEINVSLLQSSQMTGLAMMLNSLVARNASAMGGTTPAPATPVAVASPHPAPANAAT